jgi:CDP-6-deoxy-D-xylo-4-hexulose-3-dehydrase
MKVFYAKAIYNNKEIAAVNKVLKNPTALMNGPAVKEFEQKASKLFGKKFGLMVNSGSSANLLALAAFNFQPGSEIITPSLTFSTTVAPIYQVNCIPYFIDVIDRKYIANVDQIEKCINKKTVALMIPNLLGNIADWKKIYALGKKYNLKIIEDSADTIGYKYHNSTTGKLSDAVSTSFYGAHLITGAGFGGLVCFNDKKLYENAKMLREYGRSSAIFNQNIGVKTRFQKKLDGIQYDVKYIFSEMGYNFIPSEISAAFALEQLKKLKFIVKKRTEVFDYLNNFFNKYDFFRTPIQQNKTKTGWLAYPILLSNKAPFTRSQLQIHLENNQIQTRPIFSGNILRQPLMKKRFFRKHKQATTISDDVMKRGILIGCHHGLTKSEISYMIQVIKNFLLKYQSK